MSIQWDDNRIKAAILQAANKGIEAAGDVVANRAVTLIGNDHGGVPSLPGNPPNTQTGTLHKSITRTVAEAGKVLVGTAVEYGPYLEFGTSRMAPRPWIRRALAESKAQATAAFRAGFRIAFDRAIRGGGS